jgi:hypothetical protein
LEGRESHLLVDNNHVLNSKKVGAEAPVDYLTSAGLT